MFSTKVKSTSEGVGLNCPNSKLPPTFKSMLKRNISHQSSTYILILIVCLKFISLKKLSSNIVKKSCNIKDFEFDIFSSKRPIV